MFCVTDPGAFMVWRRAAHADWCLQDHLAKAHIRMSVEMDAHHSTPRQLAAYVTRRIQRGTLSQIMREWRYVVLLGKMRAATIRSWLQRQLIRQTARAFHHWV
jgi:hypothetical protein